MEQQTWMQAWRWRGLHVHTPQLAQPPVQFVVHVLPPALKFHAVDSGPVSKTGIYFESGNKAEALATTSCRIFPMPLLACVTRAQLACLQVSEPGAAQRMPLCTRTESMSCRGSQHKPALVSRDRCRSSSSMPPQGLIHCHSLFFRAEKASQFQVVAHVDELSHKKGRSGDHSRGFTP
eukprot:364262-Chlamydomonas_euryale.AAC.26